MNAEGKKIWGEIFPEGEIPVRSIIAQSATLEGIDQAERVFIVDWKELTTEQQDAVLQKLCKRSGAPIDIILKDVLRIGLPLREKYTDGSGTSRLGLFI